MAYEVQAGGRAPSMSPPGDGNDLIEGGDGHDSIDGLGGNDTLFGYDGSDTLSGGAGADELNGGTRWDTLEGGLGNDWLDGGAGNDRMWGGGGDDIYIVDHEGDRVYENAGEGLDVVWSSVDFVMRDNVEQLHLTGAARVGFGNNLDNDMYLGTVGGVLAGGGGNDTLNGSDSDDNLTGGAGQDSLIGGYGRDVLAGDDGSDVLDGGAADDILAGGDRWDTLAGGDGNDFLDGGSGNDVMFGGSGNDIYYVDHVGDRVFEGAGEGNDLVWSWISLELSANVENLYLTGEGDVSGTGNGLGNHIEGTSGANAISGGLGNDSLWGWAGNDILSGGNDHDFISGGEGADILTGGHGNDVLGGGAGADDFVFSSVAVNGHDHVVDFVHGVDRLVLTGSDYGFAGGHVLTNAQFTAGDAAAGSSAQFVWDAAAGKLWWDADGSGAGTAYELALISNGATVTKDDLYFT